MPNPADRLYPNGPATGLGNGALPSITGDEARELLQRHKDEFDAGTRDPNREFFMEPKDKETMDKAIRSLGDYFMYKNSPVTKEFLKKVPEDIEVFDVPLDYIEKEDKRGESERMIYLRLKPLTS